jgi:L-aspartate oxidase
MSESDSFESHIQDTLVAGAGLCRETVVRNYVLQAPDRIRDLLNWGVKFDAEQTLEGGHTFRRILHYEDQTGLAIHSQLLERVRENPKIQLVEFEFAIDLILNKLINPYDMSPNSVDGCYSFSSETGEVSAYMAQETILATGGAGKVYLYTSNWSGASGDGIAMAFRAGARVANLEFMQFHPTCLYHPTARNFLISEAVRGEGGELVDSDGNPFMKKYHPMGSLAPRDIVARGIYAEMKKSGDDCVYIDITHRPKEFIQTRFPLIYSRCLELGIDISQRPIPVVPAAHYLCGGVLADESGRTDLAHLWTVGESACTGLHGANRLASNSLLECLTMAHNASAEIQKNLTQRPLGTPRDWLYPIESNADEMIVIHHMWDEVRRLMWNYMGIERTNKRLERAQHRLDNILQEVTEYYSNMKMHGNIIELRNIALVADLSVKCALRRKESRGIHYNTDYPEMTTPRDTILMR